MRSTGKRSWWVDSFKPRFQICSLSNVQAHSSSGEFPSITLSACDDDDDDEEDDDLFAIQRDTVLDVGEVNNAMGTDDGNEGRIFIFTFLLQDW